MKNYLKTTYVHLLFIVFSLTALLGCVDYADFYIECRDSRTGFTYYDTFSDGPVHIVYYGSARQRGYYRFTEYNTGLTVVVPMDECYVESI